MSSVLGHGHYGISYTMGAVFWNSNASSKHLAFLKRLTIYSRSNYTLYRTSTPLCLPISEFFFSLLSNALGIFSVVQGPGNAALDFKVGAMCGGRVEVATGQRIRSDPVKRQPVVHFQPAGVVVRVHERSLGAGPQLEVAAVMRILLARSLVRDLRVLQHLGERLDVVDGQAQRGYLRDVSVGDVARQRVAQVLEAGVQDLHAFPFACVHLETLVERGPGSTRWLWPGALCARLCGGGRDGRHGTAIVLLRHHDRRLAAAWTQVVHLDRLLSQQRLVQARGVRGRNEQTAAETVVRVARDRTCHYCAKAMR